MDTTTTSHQLNPPVIFYDGECGLCNKTVQTLIKWDKQERLRYAPLQGTTAQELLPHSYTTELTTLVFLCETSIFTKSDAYLKVLSILSKHSIIQYLGRLTPRWIRDHLYDLVAKNRHRFQSKQHSCQLLSKELQQRLFLP